MSAAKDEARLRHILTEARKLVDRAQTATRAELDADDDLAAALAWRLSVIGEAAAQVSQATRDAHPTIPWSLMVGMRHRLIHGYDTVDLDIVWQTVQNDIPPLVQTLEQIVPPAP